MVPDEVNVYLWQSGFHLFFPMRGENHWRIVGILPRELRDREDVEFEEVIPSIRSELGAGLAVHILHLVFHLSDSSSRALPAFARGAASCSATPPHPQPGRRSGHEHRTAGCV